MESSLPPPDESPIIVVEDDRAVLESLTRFIGRLGYPVKGFEDPLKARDALDDGEPVHLLITDQQMPGLDGVSLVRHALEVDPSTVAMIVTGEGRVESAAEALRMGVVDYLLKPVDVSMLEMAVHRALLTRAQQIFHRHNHLRIRTELGAKTAEVERQKAQIEDLMVASFSVLVQLLEARNPHFRNHSRDVSEVGEAMAVEIGLPPQEVEAVRIGGLLHDIGMIAVPDAIIDKQGGLSSEELARIREHPVLAEKVLRPFTHLGPAVDYVLRHHERLDGSGYPDGLRGEAIPLGAQIVAVADAYSALQETRSFREPVSSADAVSTLRGSEGIWFAGRVLDALETVVSRRDAKAAR